MTEKAVSIQDMSRIHLIFGDFDNNINIIQKEYKVSIFTRDDEIRIKGDENAVDNAEQVIKTLISTVEKGKLDAETHDVAYCGLYLRQPYRKADKGENGRSVEICKQHKEKHHSVRSRSCRYG